MEITLYSFLCFLTALMSAIVAGIAWQRRRVEGGLPLALLMMAVTEWSLGTAFEYAAISIQGKIAWSVVEYAGALSSPVFLLLFALDYDHQKRWLTRRHITRLFIIPVVTFLLTATNSWHHLIWTSFTPGPAGDNLLVYGHGAGFWIGSIGYSYLLIMVGTFYLIRAAIRKPAIFHRQTVTLIVGVAVPWIGSLIYAAGLSPAPGLDLAPLFLVFSGATMTWNIYRFHLINMVPVAREQLIDTLPDGMLVLNAQGLVADVNPAAKALLRARGEIEIGLPAAGIFAPWPEIAACCQNQRETRIEITLDGPPARDYLELSISPVYDRRGRYAGQLIILRDIRDRKQAEAGLKRQDAILHYRNRTLNLLNEIVRAALQASDLQEMSQVMVDRLAGLIGADGCFLTLWDESQQKAVPTAAYGPFSKTYPDLPVDPGEKSFTASALTAGHTLVIEDALHSPYVSPRIAHLFPSQSMLAIPMMVGKNKLGAVLLSFDQHHSFTEEEIATGEQAAAMVALTAVKFQAMEQARRHAEESETLRKAGAAVAATLSSDEAVNRILEQLERVVPHDSASMQLLRAGYLEIVGGRGWEDQEAVVGLHFPVPGDNPNTIVIQTQEPYILDEVDEVYPLFTQPPHTHIRSWLGVPLIVHQRVIGVLAIDSFQPHHFTAEHARLAMAFADQVAVALENARLFGEIQDLALTDPLTRLYNRRGLFELGHVEFTRTRRYKRPFSVLLVDIDHFKLINDQYGHTTGGDPVLAALGKQCQENVREIDLVSRFGGDEFVILLPETDLETAKEVAERLRQAIAQMQVTTGVGALSITVSVGVATYDKNTADLEALIARADQAMYVAKNEGRNRVAVSR